jgi:hypothetical protein
LDGGGVGGVTFEGEMDDGDKDEVGSDTGTPKGWSKGNAVVGDVW